MKRIVLALAVVGVGVAIGFLVGLLRTREIPTKSLHELPEV